MAGTTNSITPFVFYDILHQYFKLNLLLAETSVGRATQSNDGRLPACAGRLQSTIHILKAFLAQEFNTVMRPQCNVPTALLVSPKVTSQFPIF